MAVSEQQRVQVARLIGREPRGLEAIPVSDDAGMPRVEVKNAVFSRRVRAFLFTRANIICLSALIR